MNGFYMKFFIAFFRFRHLSITYLILSISLPGATVNRLFGHFILFSNAL